MENKIVKKHQTLVRNARYRLSELGIKVLTVLIAQIKVSDHEFHQYHIPIKDFKELIGSDSKKTYEYAHKLISELMSKPMQIGDEQFNWVSYGKYQKGGGYIVFEIHRNLKPYLLELKKNFLQYKMENVLKLRSGYVIRLYELCKDHLSEYLRYNPSEDSVTFALDIARMREMFEIPKSYQYKDIRVHIIDKAVKQFREKTDIEIEYREQKIRKRVDRIIITVKLNDRDINDFKELIARQYPHLRLYEVDGKIVKCDDSGQLYFIGDDLSRNRYSEKYEKAIWKKLYKMKDRLPIFTTPSLFQTVDPIEIPLD